MYVSSFKQFVALSDETFLKGRGNNVPLRQVPSDLLIGHDLIT